MSQTETFTPGPPTPYISKFIEINIDAINNDLRQFYDNFDCVIYENNVKELSAQGDYKTLSHMYQQIETVINATRRITAVSMEFIDTRYKLESIMNSINREIPIVEKFNNLYSNKVNQTLSNNNEFTSVSKGASKRPLSPSFAPPIKIKNSFGALSIDECSIMETQDVTNATNVTVEHNYSTSTIKDNSSVNSNNSDASSSPPSNSKNPFPPIFIDKVNCANKITTDIEKLTSCPPKVRVNQENIRIRVDNLNDFKAINEYCIKNKVPAHSYDLPEERELKIVIRGLPIDMPEKDIFSHLMEFGFAPVHISRLRHRSQMKNMPLVLVRLPKTPKSQEIFQLAELSYFKIKIETLRRKQGSPQCYRCLGFFHNSRHCTRPFRCVKCGGNHQTNSTECKKTDPNTPAKCALCGGPHPASYGGCPMHPKNKASKPNSRPSFAPAPDINPWQSSKPNDFPPISPSTITNSQANTHQGQQQVGPNVNANSTFPVRAPLTSYSPIAANQFNNFLTQAITAIQKTQESLNLLTQTLVNLSQNFNINNEQ